MLILALDSTAVAASVALLRDGAPLASFHVNNGNTHSETLLPMTKALLEATGYTVDDVDVFACSVGPGSFTGVRIGAATVKGLAFGKDKPVIGVSTLEALARNLLPATGLICPVMNARRSQVYNALFRADGEQLTRLCADRALSIGELDAELSEINEPFYLVGDGAALTVASLKRVHPLPTSEIAVEQNAISVAKAAHLLYLAGARTDDAELKPVYLRLPQAERERLERQAKNATTKGEA
ncbi:MAG: tRNA (adenosine(37)-N6)-threonylcarbamoyltransferase complex dimerization subunit type 1 TsaB [Ruminococcaceae bacterium]|nr:tRNA (adenosine(37)-N6)-threonylcarbamoyltransferase complex dimerization subunit type 1 TsaB [Oscillospiraceae bacterium]